MAADLNTCGSCGRLNDLSDYEFCSGCCYEMAFWNRDPGYPGRISNFSKGFIARRLGVGTLQAISIIGSEIFVSWLMQQPVILPTPIGHEVTGFSIKLANNLVLRRPKIIGSRPYRAAAWIGRKSFAGTKRIFVHRLRW